MRSLLRADRATPASRLTFLVASSLVFVGGCLAHEKELRALAYMGARFSPPGDTTEIHWVSGVRDDDSGLGLGLTDTKLREALPYLKPLHRLHLDLVGTSVTDESMPQIARLDHLEELNVAGLGVSARGLESLRDARGLRRIYVATGQITRPEADRLRRMMPKASLLNGRGDPVVP